MNLAYSNVLYLDLQKNLSVFCIVLPALKRKLMLTISDFFFDHSPFDHLDDVIHFVDESSLDNSVISWESHDNIATHFIYKFLSSSSFLLVSDSFSLQFCMMCSTGYHVFACHSERANHRWLALDLAGICVGLIGCYLPAIHFAFYCLSVSWNYSLFLLILKCLNFWIM